jgi:hypothetical protein
MFMADGHHIKAARVIADGAETVDRSRIEQL